MARLGRGFPARVIIRRGSTYLPVNLTPGAAALTLTGSAPTVTAGGNIDLAPGAATLTLTGSAPTVTAGANVTLTPGPATLTLTGSAPTVTVPVTTTVDYGYCQSELCWGTAGPITETEVREILQTIVDLGGSRVRFGVQLGTVAELDQAVLLSREYGLKPLLCLINNSAFGYTGSVESFGVMCKTVATRYGPLGVGDLKNSVTELELFNESNLMLLNPPQVDPANHAKYLKAGYQAIKSVYSSCTVIAGGTIPTSQVGGGLFFPTFALDPVQWYTGIYAAGGGQWFDAIGMHLYAEETPSPAMRQWAYIPAVRDLMVANGDAAKKIWVTEVGAGFPAPGVQSLLMARDWLKLMIDGLLSYDYVDKFFIYNCRNYSGGDGVGASYGMVTNDFIPRQPMYDYAATIAGTPSDPGDIIPPDPPTGLVYSDVTSTTAQFNWDPNPTIDGVTNYRLYTSAGVQLGDTQNTNILGQDLPSGTPQSFYVTAVDAAGNESDPSDPVTLTTDVPTGLQASFAYTFTGSTIPTVFTQLGLGFTVSSGIAVPNAPTVDGEFTTIAPYNLAMQSPDHSSRISLAGVAGSADRTALAIVRMSADGTEWIGAASPGGGNADSLVILMCTGGDIVAVAAMNTTPGGSGDDLLLAVEGNVYTARIISPGSTVIAELLWTDIDGVYPGSTNLRAGLGWRHARSKSINYPPPGITGWGATDVAPVQELDGFDLWMFGAVDDEDDWGVVMATGLWESAL